MGQWRLVSERLDFVSDLNGYKEINNMSRIHPLFNALIFALASSSMLVLTACYFDDKNRSNTPGTVINNVEGAPVRESVVQILIPSNLSNTHVDSNTGLAYTQNELIVQFRSTVSDARRSEIIDSYSARIGSVANRDTLKIVFNSNKTIQQLSTIQSQIAALPDVKFVAKNYINAATINFEDDASLPQDPWQSGRVEVWSNANGADGSKPHLSWNT